MFLTTKNAASSLRVKLRFLRYMSDIDDRDFILSSAAEGTAWLTDNNKLLLADKARCGKIPVAAVW